jgi:hypothetical protein
MKKLIEIEKPDIVFDLNVARGIHVALGENIEIRDYILEKHHNKRQEILVNITAENFSKKLSRSSQIDLIGNNTTKISANGNDPQLYFDLPKETSKKTLNIYCQITSPADTLFKLFFQTADHQFYDETKKVSHSLRKGRNSFYLRIYEPVLLDKFRLDPGEQPGAYDIERFTIFAE